MALIWIILCAAVALALAMSGAWALQRALRNAGWVDVVWSASTGLVGAACALVPGGGLGARHTLVAAMAAAWAVRLAWHIAQRTRGAPEDARYAAFRRDWGADFEQRLFWFLMVQAAAALVLVLAITLAARCPAPSWRAADAAGVIVLAAAVAGEAIADSQLRAFRARGGGGICDQGLWGWSRHPNYFFEFLGWCAYPVMAITASGQHWTGYLALLGPAMMFWLLRYVSGVPPLEKSMLERRGESFRAYQARVSAFVPWPPAKASS
jgi:steroid 5-alpha reductase family enzyme